MVVLLLVAVIVGSQGQAPGTPPWHGEITLDDHATTVLWPLVIGQHDNGDTAADGVEWVHLAGRIEQVQEFSSNVGPLIEWYVRCSDGQPRRVLLSGDRAPPWSAGRRVAIDGVVWRVEAIRGRDGGVRQIQTILVGDVAMAGGGAWGGEEMALTGVVLGMGVVVIALVFFARRRGRRPPLVTGRLSLEPPSDDDGETGLLADDPATALSQMHDARGGDS